MLDGNIFVIPISILTRATVGDKKTHAPTDGCFRFQSGVCDLASRPVGQRSFGGREQEFA